MNTTLITGRGKTGNISNHPAPQGQQTAIPAEMRLQEAGNNLIHNLQGFKLFPVRQHTSDWLGFLKTLPEPIKIQWRQGSIGDHHDLSGIDMPPEQSGILQQ